MKKRYLFFDIDGTLIAGGYGAGNTPPSTLEALKLLRQNGHFLAIATGRSQAMAYDIMHELGFENMVSDGGCGLTLNGKLLGIRPLCRQDAVALVHECEEKGFPWALSTENGKIRIAPDNRFFDYTQDDYMQTVVVRGLKAEKQDAIYKMFVACRYPQELELQALQKLPWCRFHEKYFFVEPTEKGKGIKKMLDALQADYHDAVVFGDARNDLSMFEDEWVKVAMGNACPELKARADLVTTDVFHDGIWNACKTLGLI